MVKALRYRTVWGSIIALAMVFFLAACGNSEGASEQNDQAEQDSSATDLVFKIGGIPDQDVADLNRRFNEFADYLSRETGLTVEYVPSTDYAALVTAFKRGEVHLAWFGGLTGVQARNEVPEAEAIAQRPADEQFHSVFIAQSDLDVETLQDLKGLSFTFGSESSTSGHLMPRYFLMEEGINPEEDFSSLNYSGSHDKTYALVESGAFQAGALNEIVWNNAVEEGKVDTTKVKAFYITPPYYDYHWTINEVDSIFGEGTKEKVREALLSIDENESVLALFNTDRFIETKNENYEAIETVARELGIIK